MLMLCIDGCKPDRNFSVHPPKSKIIFKFVFYVDVQIDILLVVRTQFTYNIT